MSDRRIHDRFRFVTPVEVFWTSETGETRSAEGTSVCISLYGMAVQIPTEVPKRTPVRLKVNGLDIRGDTTVQYSKRCMKGFHLGLKLDSTLLLADVPGLEQLVMRRHRTYTRKIEPKRLRPLTPGWTKRLMRKLLGLS